MQQKPFGISGHVLLSSQVPFGALILAGGLYCFLYAYSKVSEISTNTGILYLLSGILMMGFGCYLGAVGLPHLYALIEAN